MKTVYKDRKGGLIRYKDLRKGQMRIEDSRLRQKMRTECEDRRQGQEITK